MAEREIIHVLKRSDVVNRPLPSVLKHGEPIINSADGIMYFSGVTSSTDEWTPAGTGTTANFFEVGSNLYDLKLRNQLTEYQGISGGGLTGKFLSGTTSGFALADISDITVTGANGITTTTGNTVELGGTLNKNTTVVGQTYDVSFGSPGPVANSINAFYATANDFVRLYSVDNSGSPKSQLDMTGGNATFGGDIFTGTTQLQGFTTKIQSSVIQLNMNAVSSSGATYAHDYSSNYVNRSLVDKEYVDNQITGATLTGANGITTTTGNTIELGGTLNKTTKILGGAVGNDFYIGDLAVDNIDNFYVNVSGGTTTTAFDPTFTKRAFISTSVTANPFIGIEATNFTTGDDSSLFISDSIARLRGNATDFEITSGSTTFTDNTSSVAGIEYAANYHATYTDRSLVDKEYVDNAITGVSATDTYVTGFTYDNANNITIAQNEGEADLTINLTTFSAVTISALDANSVVYTDGSGTLTTETAFAYNAGTDTMTVGNINVQNGTGTTSTFGQGGVIIGSSGIGDLTVQGDLTVLGDTTTVSTSELLIEDPTITLNYSTGTTNPTSLGSGIEIQDGDGAGTDLYLKVEELNTAYASEYPATTGAGNRAFYTSLNDIVIRQATDTTSPSVGQVGKRVLAEDDILDGGTY